MLSAKRIIFLIILAMLTGLAIVHLRTLHMQTVFVMVNQTSRQKELQQEIWQYQVQISRKIESPHHILNKVDEMAIDVRPPVLNEEQKLKEEDRKKEREKQLAADAAKEAATENQPEESTGGLASEIAPPDEMLLEEMPLEENGVLLEAPPQP